MNETEQKAVFEVKFKAKVLDAEVKSFSKGGEDVAFGQVVFKADDEVMRVSCSADIVPKVDAFSGKVATLVFTVRPDDKLKLGLRLIDCR